MSAVQEALNKWGAKHYPAHAGKNFRVECETYSEGYCETCSYTGAQMTVYAGDNKVGETYSDLATLMTEIYEANK